MEYKLPNYFSENGPCKLNWKILKLWLLGFAHITLGFRFLDLGDGLRLLGFDHMTLGFRVRGFGFRVESLGFRMTCANEKDLKHQSLQASKNHVTSE